MDSEKTEKLDRPCVVVLDDGEVRPIAVIFETETQADRFAEHVGGQPKVAIIATRAEVIDSALIALGPAHALGVTLATVGAL